MYYIFIVNDINLGDKVLTAEFIISTLFKKGHWIFSENSPHLSKLKQGDRVILYVAGKGRRYFNASFKLADEIKPSSPVSESGLEQKLYKMYNLSAKIEEIDFWENPIPILSVKEHLEFIKDKKNYGLSFRQSIRVIGEEDFNFILNSVKKTIS